MSGEDIQIADHGQNLSLPIHHHDRLPFEKHRNSDHEHEAKGADIEERELHHDVNEKDGKVQHVAHSKASIDMDYVDNSSAGSWTPTALVNTPELSASLVRVHSCADWAVANV